MRGHKFSLIWFGYNVQMLRRVRSIAIGSEASSEANHHKEFAELLSQLGLEGGNSKLRSLLNRYYLDIRSLLEEGRRVLKPGKFASFVIGNSVIRGCHVKNSEILKFAAQKVGFTVQDECVREIPTNKRYLPLNVSDSNSLAGRMRTEHVIDFIR